MTLSSGSLRAWSDRVEAVGARLEKEFPGEGPERQPVHTVYGGAHLFKENTAERLGQLALASLETWVDGPEQFAEIVGAKPDLAEDIYQKVVSKLRSEPVEDFRLDFEDGYGHRPDDEEDGHARSAALEVAAGHRAGSLPPFIGIRIKSLSPELHTRALGTLDIFLTTLAEEGGGLPEGFALTLPKIQDADQVRIVDEALGELEAKLGLDRVPLELMIETPQTVIDEQGRAGALSHVRAGNGRVRGAHFGTYDYTASLNVTAAHQGMTHPACDHARSILQVSLAGTGVWISDGATNVMPVAVHRGEDLTREQVAANRNSVQSTMRLHASHVRHSLEHAYYQGWDLHPAQLPTRYGAVYAFFLESLDQAGERLTNFVESAAKATLVGDVFDDAATGQGLLNHFLRAINCGALSVDEALTRSGLSLEELRSRSFLTILDGRRG